MEKVINLDTYIKQNKTKFRRALLKNAISRKNKARRKPRDPVERELLFQLDKARWQRWLKEGKIKFITDRHWKIKL